MNSSEELYAINIGITLFFILNILIEKNNNLANLLDEAEEEIHSFNTSQYELFRNMGIELQHINSCIENIRELLDDHLIWLIDISSQNMQEEERQFFETLYDRFHIHDNISNT